MTPKDIAAKLDGIEYDGRDFYTKVAEVAQDAKKHNIVIVYGESDDLMEFEGTFRDELSAPCKARLSRTQALPAWEDIDHCDIDEARKYFGTEHEAKWSITSLWREEPNVDWTFKTDIPHVTFNIMEEGEVFCRGIVFSISDLV